MERSVLLVFTVFVVLAQAREWHFNSYLMARNVDGGGHDGAWLTFQGFVLSEDNEFWFNFKTNKNFESLILHKNGGIDDGPVILAQHGSKNTEYSACVQLNFVQVLNMKNGKFRLTLTTTNHPDGAAYGRLWHKTKFYFTHEMSDENELGNIINAGADGFGWTMIENKEDQVKFSWSIRHTIKKENGLNDKSDEVAAHFHGPGTTNQNRPPQSIVATGKNIRSPVVSALSFADPNQGTKMMKWFLLTLMYTNFHTFVNPGGELRGQNLRITDFKLSVQKLKGTRVVPGIDNDGKEGEVDRLFFDDRYSYLSYKVADAGLNNPPIGGLWGPARSGEIWSNSDYLVDIVGGDEPGVKDGREWTGEVALFSDTNPQSLETLFFREYVSFQFENSDGPVVRGQVLNWHANFKKKQGKRFYILKDLA